MFEECKARVSKPSISRTQGSQLPIRRTEPWVREIGSKTGGRAARS